MNAQSPRSLRRAYLEWVEEQVEEFKDAIPRSRLLAIADEVVESLRLARGGQYLLTEVLLCDAMNRHLFKLLKLPGYRTWCELRAKAPLHHREIALPTATMVARPLVAAEQEPEVALAR
jgi:hypothetical protein